MTRGRLPPGLLLVALVACNRSSRDGAQPTFAGGAVAPVRDEIAELAFDGGFKSGWQDYGWSERATGGPGPAQVHFAKWGGWILAKPGLEPRSFGALVFRIKQPPGEGDFLEVRVDSPAQRTFPRVELGPRHQTSVGDGWVEVNIPMGELDPDGAPFDRVVLHASRAIDDQVTLIDKVGFTKGSADPLPGAAAYAGSGEPARLRIACDATATKISPLIYGVASTYEPNKSPWPLGISLRRWGGNATSVFNWELGVWNTGADWFFENHPSEPTWQQFLSEDEEHGVMSALTIPMIGWVARDGTSASFPVSVYGAQGKTDPSHPDMGDGTTPSGAKLTPTMPPRASVAAPPEWVKRWVETIRATDASTGKRSVYEYILDNEPMLWSQTHRDVRPEPLGYDELLERTIEYGTAVREADPDAVIAGPAEWGWTGYFYSARDGAAGFGQKPDRRAHGDVPLVEWYLSKLREYEQKTGVRILDVLDLHMYPAADNVYGNGTGGSDPKTQALRLRATRSLWDPSYTDESWIKDTVRLLPRMKEWVQKNYPGRGISIGEWSFGGEGDPTGALATAEALGRFAQFGVTSAEYWTVPPQGSSSAHGFVAYRNFDGKGGRFLDYYLPTTMPRGLSLFASRDADGKHVVAVAINMSPDAAVRGTIDMGSCGAVASRKTFGFARGATGFVALTSTSQGGSTFDQVLPPWSITVIDIQLAQPLAAGVEK